MEKLRIVFMGTPDFAVASLSKLVERGYTIVGVITAPDRPAGRGRKLQESAIKKYAKQQNIRILQPTNLKSQSFLTELRSLSANLQVVVAFRMLPKEVWSMPEYGTFNLHASLLPQYRGAAPINWAIINGETETGVTTFFLDEKIDTGEIILQEKIAIKETDTAGTLHDKLMLLGANLVLKTVEQIENRSVKRQKQSSSQNLKKAPKIHKETCRVNWNSPIQEIYNHIRGLSPYPAAWSTLFNDTETVLVKIYTVAMERKDHSLKNGQILFDKKEIRVAVPGGFVQLLEMQLSGKRKMKAQETLNGLKLSKTAHMA
jgi:methionyl-tRNA formyltransferase